MLLLDEGTFREYDRFVEHRCTKFGMEKQKASDNDKNLKKSFKYKINTFL